MPEGKELNGASKSGAKSDAIEKSPEPSITLPPVSPPQTIAPMQFNQQVNFSIQQIPTSAWDRLSSEQILEISKEIISQNDSADKRQFDYAMEEIKHSSGGKRLSVICGSVVTAIAYGIAGYLATHEQTMVAACIALPVTTVLAVIIGNRFMDRQ